MPDADAPEPPRAPQGGLPSPAGALDPPGAGLALTSSFSPPCRSLHSSMGWPRSTVFMGTFTSPMMSCLEKRSKS